MHRQLPRGNHAVALSTVVEHERHTSLLIVPNRDGVGAPGNRQRQVGAGEGCLNVVQSDVAEGEYRVREPITGLAPTRTSIATASSAPAKAMTWSI
jgi:hypothetical protein